MYSAVSMLSTSATASASSKGHSPTGRMQSVEQRFVQNWGRLAEAFGMEETAGRVHATLYLANGPLDAAAVAEHLEVDADTAEDHIQMLVSFGVVREVAASEFEAERDPWSWFMTTIRERGRREISPLIASIRAVNTLAQEAKSSPAVRADRLRSERIERIGHFTQFIDQMASLVEMFSTLGAGPLMGTMRLAAKLIR